MTREIKLTDIIQDRLSAAERIAEKSGNLARTYFNNRHALDMEAKETMDFVSEADRAVEEEIRRLIQEEFPEDGILGEEGGGELGDRSWIIDPIDGTSNFLRGMPYWGVSIGFAVDGKPQVGAIAFPALNMILSAAQGRGLFKNGEKIQRDVRFGDVRFVGIGSSRLWDDEERAMLDRHLREQKWAITELRCSTIGLGFSALGFIDGYLEKYTNIWDIAAGAVLCQEAGLEVRLDGNPIPCGLRIAVTTDELLQSVDGAW